MIPIQYGLKFKWAIYLVILASYLVGFVASLVSFRFFIVLLFGLVISLYFLIFLRKTKKLEDG